MHYDDASLAPAAFCLNLAKVLFTLGWPFHQELASWLSECAGQLVGTAF
jgi:hypothetical protein